MTWTYDNSLRGNVEFLRQFIAFLQSCCSQREGNRNPQRPEFVPAKVDIQRLVKSEIPLVFPGHIKPGITDVESNQWGAISAKDSTGKLMGIRPHECVVLAMCRNPHLERNLENNG